MSDAEPGACASSNTATSRASDENRLHRRSPSRAQSGLRRKNRVRPKGSPEFGDRADDMVKACRRCGLNDEPAVSSEVFVPQPGSAVRRDTDDEAFDRLCYSLLVAVVTIDQVSAYPLRLRPKPPRSRRRRLPSSLMPLIATRRF